MSELQSWLNHIHYWYQNKTEQKISDLQPLILHAPAQIWGPNLNPLQSKAIACWLDACLRQFEFYRDTDADKAMQYLNLAYARFQSCVAQSDCALELKGWCMQRMQQLMVLSLEYLNQQQDGELQSRGLIEAHVSFMTNHAWNNDQGILKATSSN